MSDVAFLQLVLQHFLIATCIQRERDRERERESKKKRGFKPKLYLKQAAGA
jgi:hypothetical protein